ncbi:hypothetical protein HG531_010738 [Fusarium graminearum]|nr:hypothetical protein HG531_010738 [Fusarium graminearum]
MVVQANKITSQIDAFVNTRTTLNESLCRLCLVRKVSFADLRTTEGQFTNTITWDELPSVGTFSSTDFSHNISCAWVQRETYIGGFGVVTALAIEAPHCRNNCILGWTVGIVSTGGDIRSRPGFSNIFGELLTDERDILQSGTLELIHSDTGAEGGRKNKLPCTANDCTSQAPGVEKVLNKDVKAVSRELERSHLLAVFMLYLHLQVSHSLGGGAVLDHDSLGLSSCSRCPEQIRQVFSTDLGRSDTIAGLGSNRCLAISVLVHQNDLNILQSSLFKTRLDQWERLGVCKQEFALCSRDE